MYCNILKIWDIIKYQVRNNVDCDDYDYIVSSLARAGFCN